MLEPHPPHATPHTWRDFFIHIATIVVGLIIAVGLEQSVEAIHHAHQRKELRETMERESHQIFKDAENSLTMMKQHTGWLSERTLVVRDSVWTGKPISPSAQNVRLHLYQPHDTFLYPDDPLWREAKSSGLSALLSPAERGAYSEIEINIVGVSSAYPTWQSKLYARVGFEREFLPLPDGTPDLAKATPEEKRTYLKLLNGELDDAITFRDWLSGVTYAQQTILDHNLNLDDILAAEKRRSAR